MAGALPPTPPGEMISPETPHQKGNVKGLFKGVVSAKDKLSSHKHFQHDA